MDTEMTGSTVAYAGQWFTVDSTRAHIPVTIDCRTVPCYECGQAYTPYPEHNSRCRSCNAPRPGTITTYHKCKRSLESCMRFSCRCCTGKCDCVPPFPHAVDTHDGEGTPAFDAVPCKPRGFAARITRWVEMLEAQRDDPDAIWF